MYYEAIPPKTGNIFFPIAGILTLVYTIADLIKTFSSIFSNIISYNDVPSFFNIGLNTFEYIILLVLGVLLFQKKNSIVITYLLGGLFLVDLTFFIRSSTSEISMFISNNMFGADILTTFKFIISISSSSVLVLTFLALGLASLWNNKQKNTNLSIYLSYSPIAITVFYLLCYFIYNIIRVSQYGLSASVVIFDIISILLFGAMTSFIGLAFAKLFRESAYSYNYNAYQEYYDQQYYGNDNYYAYPADQAQYQNNDYQ